MNKFYPCKIKLVLQNKTRYKSFLDIKLFVINGLHKYKHVISGCPSLMNESSAIVENDRVYLSLGFSLWRV